MNYSTIHFSFRTAEGGLFVVGIYTRKNRVGESWKFCMRSVKHYVRRQASETQILDLKMDAKLEFHQRYLL